MDPYEILNVSPHATAAEIKTAYRQLVKRFHPDVYKGNHEDMIKQLNEAYDILSDPVRKASYDSTGTTAAAFVYEYQEDPRTIQRREYVARRRAEARRKREEYLRLANATYKVLRLISFSTLLFASLIVINKHLPQTEYREVGERGWLDDSRRSSRREDSFSYMQTKNFVIVVPSHIHVDYDYDAIDKQPLTIAVSPIFRIASTVSLVKDNTNVTEDIKRTLFSSEIRAPYLLLFVSLCIVLRKNYSDFNLGMALFPIFIFVFIWMTYL